MIPDHHLLQFPLYDQVRDNFRKRLGTIVIYGFLDLLVTQVDPVKDAHEFRPVGIDQLFDVRMHLVKQLFVSVVSAARKADLQPEHIKILNDLRSRFFDQVRLIEILGKVGKIQITMLFLPLHFQGAGVPPRGCWQCAPR